MSKRKPKDWHLPSHVSTDALGYRGARDDDTHPLDKVDAWYTHDRATPSMTSPDGGKTWTNTTVVKGCSHTGTIPLFQVGNVTFGGATGSSIILAGVGLVLDLAKVIDTKPHDPIKHGPNTWLALNQLARHMLPQVIGFDWPDGRALYVPLRFWQSAFKLIQHHLPHGGHVTATCFGGHGRTGTCLASLYIATAPEPVSANAAIDFIREKHCQKAIETLEQERYLEVLAAARLAEAIQQAKTKVTP